MRIFKRDLRVQNTQPMETSLGLLDGRNVLHYGDGRSGMANFNRRLFHHHRARGASIKFFAETAIFLPVNPMTPKVGIFLGRAAVIAELLKVTDEIGLREKTEHGDFPPLVLFFINQMLILDDNSPEETHMLEALKAISTNGPKVGVTIIFDLGFRANESLVDELKNGFSARVFLGKGWSFIYNSLFQENIEDRFAGTRGKGILKLDDGQKLPIHFLENSKEPTSS